VDTTDIAFNMWYQYGESHAGNDGAWLRCTETWIYGYRPWEAQKKWV